MKVFKYKEQHNSLKCYCPPEKELVTITATVFRWIHTDLAHFNNFNPPLLIDPSRIESDEPCEIKCENYALSFFIDQDKAERKLIDFIKRKPMLAEVFGTSIGKADLKEGDGLGSIPRKNGHFNFHEFSDFNLKNTLTFVKEIKP